MDIDMEMLDSLFCYVVKTNEEKSYAKVDFSLCMYNQLYKSFEFYEEKFPKGYENIPGFVKVIDEIVVKSENNNPLKEYNNRINNI
jgi:hypothetical protein